MPLGRPNGAALCCPVCGGGRLIRHPALFTLAIAHVDCDAFFASVEKRDKPDLAARPVLVGGGRRGVVAACCYVARLYGVRSAMPMAQALRACPDAVVIKPDFAKYSQAAAELRQRMQALTPLVQSLSIDEAVLDLSGTQALHGAPPAAVLARFARQVETEMGLTVSIGLSRNRLLAKIAADRDKPRGFTVWGQDAAQILAPEPPALLPGVGPVLARRLARRGITRLGQLQALDPDSARRILGPDGPGWVRRAWGEDDRPVQQSRPARSASAETTFDRDLSAPADLRHHLWLLAEKLAARLRSKSWAAGGVVLKLKTSHHVSRTRAARLHSPTQLPDRLFEAASQLLAAEADGTAFRLIGLGAAPLRPGQDADPADLADPAHARRLAARDAIEQLRSRFGPAAIGRGRAMRPDET